MDCDRSRKADCSMHVDRWQWRCGRPVSNVSPAWLSMLWFSAYLTYLFTKLIQLFKCLFQDNLSKLAPERQNHSGFNEERHDGWQWHQLDHMQTTCSLFQTDNHASSSSSDEPSCQMLFLMPNQQCQSTENITHSPNFKKNHP